MNWAWRQTAGGTTPKVVLVKIADNADDFGLAFPSIALIAKQCEISERTVQRIIRQLQQLGLLTVEPRFLGPRRQTSNLYQLSCPAPIEKESTNRRGDRSPPLTPVTPPSLTEASPGGVTRDTRTATNQSTNDQPQQQASGGGDCGFVFPPSFDPTARATVISRLAVLDPALAQQVLDELSGRMKIETVRNPLRYLSTLIERALAGTFTPDLAAQQQSARAAAEKTRARVEAALSQASTEVTVVNTENMPGYLRDFLAERANSKNGQNGVAND
jgi:hypothetical protein